MGMRDRLNILFGSRFWALFRKELNQIRHNRQLLIQLLVPPTVFLILFGLALNPTFENLRVGITDYSQSRESRNFLELFGQTDAFVIDRHYTEADAMLEDLAEGELTVAITIPPEFERDLNRGKTAQVQAIFDAVDANTAGVASSYLNQLVNDYNQRRSQLTNQQRGIGSATLNESIQPESSQINSTAIASADSFDTTTDASVIPPPIPPAPRRQVDVQTTVFYNPGLEASWFIVPGTIGILMTVLGSQAAASRVVSEKEAGTIEQLMMTPASGTEIIMAKIVPLLMVLTLDAAIAIIIGRIIFGMPFRGSFPLFIGISVLYFFVGISIGIMIATYAKSEQQAQLTAFFINPPLVLLSGANTPIAAMPVFFQWLTFLDPMRYYIEVCRGIVLKGVGLEALWSQVLVLCGFAIALTTLSIRHFRRQLS